MFTKKKILVIHSQQPFNQYAGGVSGINDSEQYWMRKLAEKVVVQLKALGHDVRLGPTGDASSTFRTNVSWVERAENRDADLLLSLHSNATGKPEHAAFGTVGIGVYHHPSSTKGRAFADKLLPFVRAASAKNKAYVATIAVSEVADTTPPALLVENEYHDWVGNAVMGGADWIRAEVNMDKLALAYRDFIVSMWGKQDQEPLPDLDGDLFRFGSYNAQLPQFGGGPVSQDIQFLRSTLKPSICALQEVNEKFRLAIEEELDWNYWTAKTLGLFWMDSKWGHGEIIKDLLDTPYHGLVGTELTSQENGNTLVAASAHGLPNDAFPKSWSKAKKAQAKLDAIKDIISVLDQYPRVVIGGDWNIAAAREIFLSKGYTLVTPYVDTLDIPGDQRYDMVVAKGIPARTKGSVHKTEASDHHGLLANLTLPGKGSTL